MILIYSIRGLRYVSAFNTQSHVDPLPSRMVFCRKQHTCNDLVMSDKHSRKFDLELTTAYTLECFHS